MKSLIKMADEGDASIFFALSSSFVLDSGDDKNLVYFPFDTKQQKLTRNRVKIEYFVSPDKW